MIYLQELGASKAHFSLQVKDDTKPFPMPSWYVVHALKHSFQKELKRLQEL